MSEDPRPPGERFGHGGAARRYSWPPFEKGNTISTRHGAFSERRVAPLAREIVEHARSAAPWLDDAANEASVAAWSRAEARIVLLEAWLADRGLVDEDGKVRHAAQFLVTCEKQAAHLRHELGLTPMSKAKLGRDIAGTRFDLARAWAAEADEDTVSPPDEGDRPGKEGSHRTQAEEDTPDV